MFDPVLLKWIHILSAILLFGTGLGTAFHGMMCNLSGDLRAIAVSNRNVVLADWLFTTPAVIIQPVSGALLAWEMGWSLTDGWLLWSIGLYALAGVCWLPVVWLQIRMRRLAEEAIKNDTPLPPLYRRYFRMWFLLGWPAFSAMVAVVWLMVDKPSLY